MACACSAGRSSRRLRRCRTPLHDLENARQENSSARTRSVRALLVALRLRSGSGERGSLALVLRPTLRGVVRPTHLGAAGGELPEQAGLLGRVLHVGLLEPAVGQREPAGLVPCAADRSEERRVGDGGGMPLRYRWFP